MLVCLCHNMHVKVRVTTCRSDSSPSTIWVPERELRSSDLAQRSHLLSHLSGPYETMVKVG